MSATTPLMAPDGGYNPVLDANRLHRTKRKRTTAVWATLSAAALIVIASTTHADHVTAGVGHLTSVAQSLVASASSAFSSTSSTSSHRPATAFAPFVNETEENKWLFLRDRQHPTWEDEIDRGYEQYRNWTILKSADPVAVSQLNEQKTCLTYESRYASYMNNTVENVPLPPTAGAKTALMLHVYKKVLQPPMSPDLHRHIRALIAEAQLGSGIDVWLSIHMGNRASQEEFDQVHSDLPLEFQNRTIAFDSEQLFGKYVDNSTAISRLLQKGRLPCENHYTASYFMDSEQGKQYDRVWWLESDVRQTGSWTSFFNHMNQTIPRELPPKQDWQADYPAELAEWNVQEKGPWQPDYLATIFISGNSNAGNWDQRGREAKLIFGDDIAKAFIHFWGMSRRFHNVLKQYLEEGQVADAEYVIPSVVKRHGIPMWISRPPADRNPNVGNGYGTYGGFLPKGADPYYRAWHDDAAICRRGPTLLHAVKAWKKEKNWKA